MHKLANLVEQAKTSKLAKNKLLKLAELLLQLKTTKLAITMKYGKTHKMAKLLVKVINIA